MATSEERSDGRKGGVEPPGRAAAANGIFAVRGEYWTLGYGGTTFPLKDVKGLSYIQRLLQHPEEEFHSLDLLSGPGSTHHVESGRGTTEGTDTVGGLGDSGEMLDAQAKQAYKRRLRELNEELEEQRERGNHERAELVKSEIGFYNREMARAVGLGGRDRRAGSASERARLNVKRAITGALQKISEQQPSMGELLDREISTGTFCSYTPDPRIQVTWQFSVGSPEAPGPVASAVPFFPPRETSFLRGFTEGTTFVGREAEHATLARCLEQALAGEGRIVLISGAAGVGKTRIAAEISAKASRRGMRSFVGSCYDREDPVPFNPVVEILEEWLAQTRDMTAFRETLGNDAPEMARLLPQLRRLFPDIPPPLELPPEQSRRILFGAVADLIARAARNAPVLFLLDDLHWADEGTLLLLNHLAQLVPKLPILVVGTYRDFELIAGGQLARTLDELIRRHLVERINLGGLSEGGVAEMLRALSGREPPESLVRLFYSNTEGNPFFVEELFSHLREQGKLIDSVGEFRRDLRLSEVDVPQSCRLVIGRRLARLNDATLKALGAAAVIGRSFAFDLLAESTKTEPDRLLDSIEEAERAGLITSTLEYPEARFRFCHELTRQAVVGQLSVARRQRLHLNIAEAIEHLHPDALEDHVNDLAHHLWQAGTSADGGRTARFLAMAAKRALEQGALTEAEGFFRQALDVLETTAESPAHDRQELELQLALGQVFIAVRGYTAVETASAYDRASTLGERLGEPIQIVLALGGLYGLALLRGDMDGAQAFADRVRAVADRCGSSATRAWGWHYQGVPSYHRGRLALAHDYFAQVLAVYREDDHQNNTQDPGVESLDYMSVTAWQLGMADSARARMREAITLADRLRKPYVVAYSRFFAAYLHVLLRDPVTCQRFAEEVTEQSSDQSLPFIFEICRILRGWALAQQGRCDEGITCAREGLASFMAGGNRLSIGTFSGFLAESLALGGHIDEALARVGEAIAEVGDQLLDLPYLLRVRGDLLVHMSRGLSPAGAKASASPAADLAEQSFRESMSLASRIGAKSYELRAATSLGRLLISRGRSAEVHELVSPLWSSFTEGFETRDLIEAKALLNTLRSIA